MAHEYAVQYAIIESENGAENRFQSFGQFVLQEYIYVYHKKPSVTSSPDLTSMYHVLPGSLDLETAVTSPILNGGSPTPDRESLRIEEEDTKAELVDSSKDSEPNGKSCVKKPVLSVERTMLPSS